MRRGNRTIKGFHRPARPYPRPYLAAVCPICEREFDIRNKRQHDRCRDQADRQLDTILPTRPGSREAGEEAP